MDHHGDLEKQSSMRSQTHEGGVIPCDNLLDSKTLSVQTQNLNETNTLTQTQDLPLSETVARGKDGLIQTTLQNDNGSRKGEERRRNVGNDDCSRDEEEDEDTDEVMNEEEEEQEEDSESSFLSHCQSPGTPMTDSSYSETGSLFESSCPFTSGTSPGPSSPTLIASSVETSQSDADVGINISKTAPIKSKTTGSATRATLPVVSGCIRQGTDMVDKVTSCRQPTFECRPTETQVLTSSCPGAVTSESEPLVLNTGCTPIIADSSSTSGPGPSNWEPITSAPVTTSVSSSTCATAPIPSSVLLEFLEQLAQRGDDSQLPHYLHQIAEALVIQKDYQQALWCIQLERFYHQRVLDNLNALQEQWEGRCERASLDLTNQQLDTLKNICQTHTRPRTRDAECWNLDFLRAKFEEANKGEEGMAHVADNSSKTVLPPSINSSERLSSPEISERDREDPGSVYGGALAEKAANNREHEKAEGGEGHTITVMANGLHPSTAGGMDQSISAEQQGQDLDSAQKKDTDTKEERDVEVAFQALEMEDEEEEEEEKKMERDSSFLTKPLPVETLVSGTALELQALHQDGLCPEKPDEETLPCHNTQERSDVCLETEVPPPHEFNRKHDDQQAEELVEEEDEEEDYDVDLMREAPLLDHMAKLISIEEMSPASGLVSILKKQNVCPKAVRLPPTFEMQPEKGTTKRRVRFKVADDCYDPELGSGDSCLLLFLLCLVTVVISVGGTALYCALGDAQSSVCQDFSRNADFYCGQIQHVISQIQHWFALGL